LTPGNANYVVASGDPVSKPIQSGLNLVGIVASLRAKSMNRALFKAAIEVAPAGITITEVPIGNLPHFNQDPETPPLPAAVEEFHAAIRPADGVLFFTPEYNYSIPGVLKNAIDWGSRPAGSGSLNKKPVMIFGAAGGRSGTMRAQIHLRSILCNLEMHAMPKPEFVLPFAGNAMENGQFTDASVRDQLKAMLDAFASWVQLLKQRDQVLV
jgi:chromate reductase, NAD(P)H dehydrogenase (quinone)